MPFTPFHMGPGLLFKALLRRYFSLMVFGFSQFIIDLDPLIRIIRRDDDLHGFTHTYVGATLIAIVAIVFGRPLCQWIIDKFSASPDKRFLGRLFTPREISWIAAISGALIGAYSHVAVDSIMHFDIQPMVPWSPKNKLLYWVSVEQLHYLCVWSGVLGALLFPLMLLFRKPQ